MSSIRRLLLLLSVTIQAVPSLALQITFYLSPTGSDSNNGTKHFPLATIEAALTRVSQQRKDCRGDLDITIQLEPGIYSIEKPIVVSPKVWNNCSNHLTICGKGIGKTIISGGFELPSFVSVENTNLWVSDVGDALDSIATINQLFVNNRRAILARTPNTDKYFIPIEAKEACVDEKRMVYSQKVLLSKEEIARVIEGVKQYEEPFATIFHYWDMSRRKVKSFDVENGSFMIEGASVKRWKFFKPKNSTQLYFENSMCFLDTPGEFYFDKNAKKLYYYPHESDSIDNTKAIVPVSNGFLEIKGTLQKPLANISVRDLSFSYSSYTMPERGEEPEQSVASKGAGIVLDYSSNVSFTNVEVCHTGENAIWFREACFNSVIEHCYLHDLGAGGVKIGIKGSIKADDPMLTRKISVNNTIICEGGRTLPPAVGISLLKASDCSFTHNDIFDFYYTGISVGWSWGFRDSPTKRNNIGFNHIHHLGWGGLSDMGGIYTLGQSEGTVITNNVIHDVYTYGSDGNGIYLDEGTSNVTVVNNIVYRCKSSGFAQHYGRGNKVVNNLFFDNFRFQLGIGIADQDKNGLIFKNNIVCNYSPGQVFSSERWGNYINVEADSNMYWAVGQKNIFNKQNMKTWVKETGKDYHSIIANPVIRFDKRGSIHVLNTKAAKQISFKPIDCDVVGIYGLKKWKELAEMDSDRKLLYDKVVKNNKQR